MEVEREVAAVQRERDEIERSIRNVLAEPFHRLTKAGESVQQRLAAVRSKYKDINKAVTAA